MTDTQNGRSRPDESGTSATQDRRNEGVGGDEPADGRHPPAQGGGAGLPGKVADKLGDFA